MEGRAADAAELPTWLWAGLPTGSFVALAALVVVDPALLARLMAKDDAGGLVEAATVIVLLPAIAAGVVTLLRHRRGLPSAGVVRWVLLWTLACVYFAGEEISWGQWIFGWESPEFFREHNAQQETGLHNMSGWLDEHPRSLVEIGMVVGGVLLPLRRRARGERRDDDRPAAWYWPTLVVLPAALLTLVVRLPRTVEGWTGWEALHPLGSSELRELYTASFLALYLTSIRVRAAARAAS